MTSIDLHIHHHFDPTPAPDPRLDQVLGMLQQLTRSESRIMATLADVQAAVAAEKTVEDSIVTLLNSIAQQLRDAIASADPAAMQAVVDQITANTQALTEAVTANTPAAP